MPKAIEINVKCPFFKGEGKNYITCEGLLKGTLDRHIFENDKDRKGYEKLVCSHDYSESCLHCKRVNELYEKGLR